MSHQGGTTFYCPVCCEHHKSMVIPLSTVGEPNEQRHVIWSKDIRIHFFRRLRKCSNCLGSFVTNEIEENDMKKILSLRFDSSDIKYVESKVMIALQKITEERDILIAELETIGDMRKIKSKIYNKFDPTPLGPL